MTTPQDFPGPCGCCGSPTSTRWWRGDGGPIFGVAGLCDVCHQRGRQALERITAACRGLRIEALEELARRLEAPPPAPAQPGEAYRPTAADRPTFRHQHGRQCGFTLANCPDESEHRRWAESLPGKTLPAVRVAATKPCTCDGYPGRQCTGPESLGELWHCSKTGERGTAGLIHPAVKQVAAAVDVATGQDLDLLGRALGTPRSDSHGLETDASLRGRLQAQLLGMGARPSGPDMARVLCAVPTATEVLRQGKATPRALSPMSQRVLSTLEYAQGDDLDAIARALNVHRGGPSGVAEADSALRVRARDAAVSADATGHERLVSADRACDELRERWDQDAKDGAR